MKQSVVKLSAAAMIFALMLPTALVAAPLAAQDAGSTRERTRGDGSVVIDILAPVMTTDEADASGDCVEQASPGKVGGLDVAVVVCGEEDDSPYYYSGSREAAEDAYAKRTAFAGDILTPNVDGKGITDMDAAAGIGIRISNLCGFLIFNPCPPPKPYMIDFASLPDTPLGSNADRVGKGLSLRVEEEEEDTPRTMSDFEKRELGLPEPLPENHAQTIGS